MPKYNNKEALLMVNPCGVEKYPATHCKHVDGCRDSAQEYGEFLCLSKLAYQLIQELIKGGSLDRELRKLGNFIKDAEGKTFANPEERWHQRILKKEDLWGVMMKILFKAGQLHQEFLTLRRLIY